MHAAAKVTPFQKRVYAALITIPRGNVISYGNLAKRVGCKSARAVGQALRKNPFAPKVPCHRVISASGKLTGFWGSSAPNSLAQKRSLLEAEGITFDALGHIPPHFFVT